MGAGTFPRPQHRFLERRCGYAPGAALILALALVAGCSGAGSGDVSNPTSAVDTGGAPANDGGDGGSSGETAAGLSTGMVAIETVMVPAFSPLRVTVTGEPAGRASTDALTQSGGTVNEIIFISDSPITVEEMHQADEGITYFLNDRLIDDVRYTPTLPFPFPPYYWWLYNGSMNPGDFTMGAVLPMVHTAASSFPDGTYDFVVANWATEDAIVNIFRIFKTDPDFTAGTITLNFFIYTDGRPNAVVRNESEVERVRGFINEIFSQAGITVGAINVEFRNDPGAIAQMSDNESMKNFLWGAALATQGRTDTGINCFLMPRLPDNKLGQDGIIPGPGFLHGTTGSGILVQATPYGFRVEGMDGHEVDQRTLAKILAHEIGHYMGLYHTSEGKGRYAGTKHDPLADTPECGLEFDFDGDGVLSGGECRGRGAEFLMFWVADRFLIERGDFQTTMSNQQGDVMNTNPSAL